MENCQTCGAPSVVEVTDTLEFKTGVYVPLRKRGGCAAHPPVGLKVDQDGTLALVAPTGYKISDVGTLVKS